MVSVRKEPMQDETMFANPFQMTDLMVFDDAALSHVLNSESFDLTGELLAQALQATPRPLVRRVGRFLPPQQRLAFLRAYRQPIPRAQVEAARSRVLDALFWELTYWKTPELYEQLTEGEHLHPGIFQRLEAELRDKVVLDVGAGSGRASFECLRHGAKQVYAVEPSPGLLHLLEQKLSQQPEGKRLIPCSGRFDRLPLQDESVDLTLSCSAFTTLPGQGGEKGLAEMKRVTRSGGKIILIWPRVEDREWLLAHDFQYVSIPLRQEMRVRFRSLQIALQCAQRFYANNREVLRYLLRRQRPEVPFSVLGMNPPHEYCWLTVEKIIPEGPL